METKGRGGKNPRSITEQETKRQPQAVETQEAKCYCEEHYKQQKEKHRFLFETFCSGNVLMLYVAKNDIDVSDLSLDMDRTMFSKMNCYLYSKELMKHGEIPGEMNEK
jgi:hypothetical protein